MARTVPRYGKPSQQSLRSHIATPKRKLSKQSQRRLRHPTGKTLKKQKDPRSQKRRGPLPNQKLYSSDLALSRTKSQAFSLACPLTLSRLKV